MNNSQKFTSYLEEIIREIFMKIFEGINEKDNEISVLNSRINSYVKQIDLNIKRSSFLPRSHSKGFINLKKNNNSNNNGNNNNLLNNIKRYVLDIKNENNRIYNDYFKNKNNINDKILMSIVENFFKQINNLWDIITNESNNLKISKDNNKINNYYNRVSQSSNNLNISINLNNINCKSLLKQYFKNVSKFSKVIVDYAINDEDEKYGQ